MASWALTCKSCSAFFGYSRIPMPDTLAEYFIPSRPEFPPIGVNSNAPVARRNLPTGDSNLFISLDKPPNLFLGSRWSVRVSMSSSLRHKRLIRMQ
jgi:hypothetical protein